MQGPIDKRTNYEDRHPFYKKKSLNAIVYEPHHKKT